MNKNHLIAILTASSALCAASLPALASDFPAAKPVHVAVGNPENSNHDWNGIYGGLNGGYAFGHSKAEYAVVNGAEGAHFDDNGGLAGGQIGFNFQSGNMVFGFETDIDWSHIKGSTIVDEVKGSRLSGQVDWFGTVRARIGFAVDNLLIYGTGGFAYGGIKVGLSNYIDSSSPYLSSSATATGWTAGGGSEFALNKNWSIKGEYLYVSLGNASFSLNDGNTQVASGKGNTYFNVMRAGLNYKF